MNLLPFESIRSIRSESSLAKSNRHTGNLFTFRQQRELFSGIHDMSSHDNFG